MAKQPTAAHDFAHDPALADRYEQLLREAQQIKGVSLWRDAWRRLRKNKVAMLSLMALVTIGLLALLTPLLPLQAPKEQSIKQRRLLGPNLQPVSLGENKDLRFESDSLTAELARFDDEVEQLEQQARSAPEPQRAVIARQLANKLQTEHPFDKLWNEPNRLIRTLIRLRLAVFGDWCIPSIFGTDSLGRDLLARVFWGARVSLMVGIVATLVSLVIGVTYGATAGYLGGAVDNLMMRIVDVLYSIPFIFVVIFIITILSAEQFEKWMDEHHIDQIMIFFLLIGAIYWLTMARVVRGQVISLKNDQFIEAARTIGAGRSRIIFRHLVPNVMGIVIVYLTLTIPAVMLFEAFLSFLGLGVSPPDVSWGLLVNEGIQVITKIRTYWWLVLFPGMALALTLFALNFLGDGLRDALDPRMKNRA